MKSLRSVAVGGPLPEDLGVALAHFLLEVPNEEDVPYLKHLETTGTAPSYEEISTFEETVKRFDGARLGAAIRTLIRGDQPGEERESAKQLIQFFGAIESQALSRYAAFTQARIP